MRPLLVLWLSRHGLPPWLAPNYFVLAGLSTIAACFVVMRLARRDGADLRTESRTLLCVYFGALFGGYVLEAIRAIPEAVELHSLAPILGAGRAAYGGLLFAGLAAGLYLTARRQPLAPFFDRVSIPLGLIYAAVRSGCFLAGCDYGLPTASPLGVRYPPGSLAALDHAARGWVPHGAPSLPTHPTQLYEGAWALCASLVAWLVFRRRHDARTGSAFATWIALYAMGRFAIEFFRGDGTRGLYAGLSTAQLISIALCCLVGVVALHQSRLERPSSPRMQAGGVAL